jgi:acetyltransferase
VEAAKQTGKPVLLFSNFCAGFQREVKRRLDDGGIPYLQGTRETLRAIQAFVDYATFRRARGREVPMDAFSPPELPQWRERLREVKGSLSEVEARRLVVDYGIPAPRERVAGSADEAAEAARSIGYPVVLKILSPHIQHKTEIGGVRVGLADEAAVRSAFEEVMEAARERHPHADIEGVLIQEMVGDDAVEVIVGVLRDADFGPVVVFGFGGVLVELFEDSSLRLPPLSRSDARAMIEETQAARLLEGFRGNPPADVEALVDALVRVSQLAVDLGDQIAALDINPLMVLPEGQGVLAVDALAELI